MFNINPRPPGEWGGQVDSRICFPPTFLQALVERLLAEADSEHNGNQHNVTEEPMFDMTHGMPRSGKSELINWIREAFECFLGWTRGVQFVCLAFQDGMTAHNNGYTVHHWAGSP